MHYLFILAKYVHSYTTERWLIPRELVCLYVKSKPFDLIQFYVIVFL